MKQSNSFSKAKLNFIEPKKFAIVGARFHEELSNNLVDMAVSTIKEHGGDIEPEDIFRVPGSFEIPVVTSRLALTGQYDGIVVTGVIIKGETPHFDHLAAEVTRAVSCIGIDNDLPVGYGIVLANTMEQAVARASLNEQNKGKEAALAMMEAASVLDKVDARFGQFLSEEV